MFVMQMLALLLQFILIFITVLVSIWFGRRYNIKRKLWWVQAAPGYPVVGNALEFQDLSKNLDVMRKYATNYNGLCYIDLGFSSNLIASDTDFLKWFLSSNSILSKSDPYQYLHGWLGEGVLISGGNKWRKSRKILTPAFHFSILEQFMGVFEDATDVLIGILSKEVDKEEVDIHTFITNYTLDVVCQTSMGVQLNLQKQHHSDYIEAVGAMGRIIMERTFNPLKMFDLPYRFSRTYQEEKKLVKLLHEVSNSVINRRRKEIEDQENAGRGDSGKKRKMAFLDLLLKYRDENGEPLSDKFIRQEVDTMMFAGHDTTAAALGFAMYLLAKHPEAQAETLAEAKRIIGDKTKLTISDLQDLKYLDLVIKETLRLYPSVPFYARKVTEDLVYDGYKTIPKGLTVIVVANAVNRDATVYDKPDDFIPTRFLDNEPKPFSYLPFSAGPRNCIGQKFAVLELKMALAKILLNFELLQANPLFEPILESATVLKSRNGVKIRLKKRT